MSHDGTIVGFISDGDIIRYLKKEEPSAAATDSSAMFMNYLLDTDSEFQEKVRSIIHMNVLQIGTDHPITIQANTSIQEACRLLSESGIKKIPVLEGNQAIGILLRSSITHYLEKQYILSIK